MTAPIVASPSAARTIHTHDLSREAIDYLRSSVRILRHAQSAVECAAWANAFAVGYRAWHDGTQAAELASQAGWEGWDFAKGEDAWLQCRYIDACQDSAAACDWPASALW